MLEVNVSQLVRGVIGTNRVIDIDDEIEMFEYKVGKMTGRLKLTKTSRSILVKGHIKTSVILECARCLKQFEQPMEFDVEDEYYISNNVKLMALEAMGYFGNDVEEDDNDKDDTLIIDERMHMDLSEVLRQYVLMNVPMKPLCDVNCHGEI
ncbi:MAG: DUF177 domain-containing protein [Dehalococcoidales bacterium]|nr:DUF177 domain-containing protein [Dehalococcoidales bacterium]